jgi:chromatin structure-remodeling complex subunit SFH1
MATFPLNRQNLPQGFISSYSPRLRTYRNSLLAPVFPQANTVVPTRTTKRGTTAINYAEDGYDDDDFDDSEGPRRPTGLRSLRRDDSGSVPSLQHEKVGKEIIAPIDVQGIWREWMGKPKRAL